jgi:hypothetical protein
MSPGMIAAWSRALLRSLERAGARVPPQDNEIGERIIKTEHWYSDGTKAA